MNVLRTSTALRTLAIAALLFSGSIAPASATVTRGPAQTGQVSFKTALTPDWHGVGEYDGYLTLTIGADGIVSGYFRQADSARLSNVTGGLDGDHIWLDLGQGGLSHLEGTFDGRNIDAGIYLLGQNYTFVANPQRS